MIARTIAIPFHIYSDPLWAQLVADTLPVMAFASAWTMLVSFFVQLVGVALGTGTSTTPGTVIQITAYCVYSVLVFLFFFNMEAAVLLYALLCCIYAALLGTSMYFCPRLLFLLYPSLVQWRRPQSSHTSQTQNPQQHTAGTQDETSSPPSTSPPIAPPALAVRLGICSCVCLFVFAARTINFANKIVSPAHTASWWWQYGALELFPSALFLIIIKHPKMSSGNSSNNKKAKNDIIASRNAGGGGGGFKNSRANRSFQSTDSYGSGSRPTTALRTAETTPLVRPPGGYGSSGGIGGGGSAASLDHGAGRYR
jgi:hypothetical protein